MTKRADKKLEWYNRTPRNTQKYAAAESYSYRSAEGSFLWEKQCFRLKPGETLDEGERDKYFTQRRPDPDGIERGDPDWRDGWVYNLDGVHLVIYRLPELMSGLRAEPQAPIFICEGEKDCHSLLKLNEAALVTTSPSTKVWRSEWNEVFRGREIVIIPDNDDVGRSYRDLIGKELKPIARSVRVVELPGLGKSEDLTDWIAKGGSCDQLTALVARAEEWRPTILVRPGAIHEAADQAEQALLLAGAAVYAYGGKLVQPVAEEVDASNGRRTVVARLLEMTDVTMVEALSAAATWEKYDGRQRRRKLIDPPVTVAKTILEREGRWRLRRVTGIITNPTLRPDGSILSAPGYDQATGLLLVDPPDLPAMPEEPAREDAEAALKLLEGLLAEFPIVGSRGSPSSSVALSALITPVVRGALGAAPMHSATAPQPGTGKSYLFDISAAISTGRPCPVIAAGRTEEETEKRLDSALIDGQPLVSIDNVNGELRGDKLCQAITSGLLQARVLGKSKMVQVENRATIFANGNNIKISGDLVRRAIRCEMDAKHERPETRRFKRKPVKDVLAYRGRFIAAALTIVRAFILAGRPGVENLSPLAGFEDWTATVRGALVWLGRADPVETVSDVRADDPRRAQDAEALSALADALGTSSPVAAGEIKTLASRRPDLHEALLTVAGRAGQIESRALGRWLALQEDKIIDGLRIESEWDAKRKQKKWRVVRV